MTSIQATSLPKVHLSLESQIALLKKRGMIFSDEEKARTALNKINYYRLSGYWYPFRKTNPVGTPGRQDDFRDNTSFELILSLYDFDRNLRLLTLAATERIEVALRSEIAFYLGKRNIYAHECPSELDGKFTKDINPYTNNTYYYDWCQKLNKSISRSYEEFVDHHLRKYAGKMPIWVVTELWDFGQLSKFYEGMKYKDRQNVVAKYCTSLDVSTFVSWLKSSTYIRNVCAHHSRLWNKNMTVIPSIQANTQFNFLTHIANDNHAKTRVYGTLCILRLLMKWIALDDDWHQKLKELTTSFPDNDVVSLADAGFPNGWETRNLWK